MLIKIKNRYNGNVLFSHDCEENTLKITLDMARKAQADLAGADLTGADLTGADLKYADLTGADLKYADLAGADLAGADLKYADLKCADLTGADLTGADLKYADLTGANLKYANLAGANLKYADLTGADLKYADLAGADLTGANLAGAPSVPNIHQVIYAAASAPGALNMGSWHCGTTHCRAGWVITIAGEAGKALEDKIGTPAAAMAIYMASDTERWKTERLPNFYCDNENALADMRRMAEEESKQA